MTLYVTGTKAEVDSYNAAATKAFNDPVPEHLGTGDHVDIDSPDRVGWIRVWCDPLQHPTAPSLWAICAADLDGDPELDPSRLDPGEQALLRDAWATAAPLSPDWWGS